MNSSITTLLSGLDNIEIIRNQIAAILQIEAANQYALAVAADIPDKQDYKVSVFVERARPWALTGDSKNENPFPLINVMLDGTQQETTPGGVVNEKKYIGKFSIDCYGCGNADSEGDDDALATIRAWSTGRIARNILMSSFYTYLGLRGTVRKREILEMKTGAPTNLTESALSITVCRITFTVDFSEKSPQAEGVINEGIFFKSLSDSGVILTDI